MCQTEDVKDIRITDPFLLKIVAAEQKIRGDKSATKTAARLISERLTQLEHKRDASIQATDE